MSEELEIIGIEQPTRIALRGAIAFLEADIPDKSAEEFVQATIAIVGEACALIANGKTKEETIAELKQQGLSEGTATPLVEKAAEVVEWNNKTQEEAQATSYKAGAPYLLAGVLIVFVAIMLIFIGR